MAGDNKVAAAQPAAAAATDGANGEQPVQEKTFIQKYGGSIAQMIFFWLLMKVISGGKKIQQKENYHIKLTA